MKTQIYTKTKTHIGLSPHNSWSPKTQSREPIVVDWSLQVEERVPQRWPIMYAAYPIRSRKRQLFTEVTKKKMENP